LRDPLLKFDAVPCTIKSRVNRFVVEALIDGSVERLHNTNTGRLEGVIVPGKPCLAYRIRGRRLSYRLAAVEYGGGYAVVDTLLQARAFEAAVARGILPWLRGCKVSGRNPRVPAGVLDYRLDCSGASVLVELKSAVLMGGNGEAMYPDCPTSRGLRHIQWLAEAHARGVPVMLVFVAAFPGARCFKPNRAADPATADAILHAWRAGVPVKAFSLEATREGWVAVVNPDLPLCMD
jgi:sugar fermentation stimulation protein A